MRYRDRFSVILLSAVALLALCGTARGQEPDLAQLDRARARTTKNPQLTETEKKQILATYDDAMRALQDVWRFRTAEKGHQRRTAAVGKDIQALRDEMLRPSVYPVEPESPDENSQTADEALERAITERNARLRVLSDLSRTGSDLGKREDALAKRRTELALAADAADDRVSVASIAGSEAWEEAARVYSQCRKLAIQAEIDSLNAERKLLLERRAALPLQRDAAKLRLEAADGAIATLNARSRAARERDAARELAHARTIAEQAAAASPKLARAASDVIDISGRLWGPSGVISLQQDMSDVTAQMKLQVARVKEVAASVKRRYEAAGRFSTVSDWLEHVPRDLPHAAAIRQLRRARLFRGAVLRREILSLEEQRRSEPALESQIEQVRASASGEAAAAQKLELTARQVLQLRRNLIEDLLRTSQDLEARVSEFDTVSAELLGYLDDLRAFASGRVLWSRSVAELPSLRDAASALLWFVWNPDWRGVASTVYTSGTGLATGLIVCACIAFVWMRRRMTMRRLFVPDAEKPGAALLKTAIIAASPPAVLMWIGALAESPDGPPLGHALSAGCRAVAWLLFPLVFLLCATRQDGMMLRHFGWNADVATVVRREIRWLSIALPVAWFFVAALAEVGSLFSDDPFLQASHNSLGRFAFFAAMACVFVAGMRLLSPVGPVSAEIRKRGKRALRVGLLANRVVLAFLVVLATGLAAAGFFTTALVLVFNTFWTMLVSGALAVIAAVVVRWRENRKRTLLRSADPGAAQAEKDEAQVRQLARFGLMVVWSIAALAIWSRVIPALAMLDNIEILPGSQRVVAVQQSAPAAVNPAVAAGVPKTREAAPGSVPETVSAALTLLDVLKAGLAAIVTVILVRNVPGLLNFVVLDRFRLDSGAIYAAGAVARYVVMLVGLGAVSGLLGINWREVQWLAAALTVGIGFGLQEIFANFASGLILLFDRSIRVGDVVSVGELSGRVSNIQMRATTVTLWDRSEMVVPNKEFITSKLVNWTLSLPETRVDVKVGVAYDSDLDLVRKVLYEIAAANRNVLSTPRPEVLLTAFADSAITFELRVFCLFEYGRMTLLDELHMAVYREFSRHGISIAYPQLDVHVMGLPSPAQSQAQTAV